MFGFTGPLETQGTGTPVLTETPPHCLLYGGRVSRVELVDCSVGGLSVSVEYPFCLTLRFLVERLRILKSVFFFIN